MAVRLSHPCSKATLPFGAFAPRRARRAGQPYSEAIRSFPTGYPPNPGGHSPPQCGSSSPAQPFPCPAGLAGAGSTPLLSSLPRLPLLYLHVYFMISIFNASAL